MRTTIRIDDDLYRRARAAAASRGQTVGELIEDAVAVALQARPQRKDPRALPVVDGPGLLPGVELHDSRALLDLMGESDPTR